MKIGELFFNLGFKADTMKLKDFGKAIGDLNMASILTAGSFGAVYEGAKALIGIADQMALGINKFGRETGQSTQDIQKWNKMAEQMGVSAGTVAGSVATLEDNLFKMKFTGEGSNIWAMLGLDPTHTKDMFEVLTMLREKLKGMSTEQQRFFLQNLGLSTEMLNMFKMTDQQWASMNKQTTMMDPELKKMQEYHETMVQYGQNLNLIWQHMGLSLSPVAKSLMDVANSIDQNILKSSKWAAFMKIISDGLEGIAHPVDTLRLFTGTKGDKSDMQVHPLFKFPWQKFNQDGTYASDQKPVQVNLKAVVQTTDPHANVKIYTEQHRKTISDAVHNMGGDGY